jgi:hypothetical protein
MMSTRASSVVVPEDPLRTAHPKAVQNMSRTEQAGTLTWLHSTSRSCRFATHALQLQQAVLYGLDEALDEPSFDWDHDL